MGDGAKWAHDGRPRRLRNTRFVHAVATYEDDYKLFFCWVGRSVTAPMLQAQYDSRRASGPRQVRMPELARGPAPSAAHRASTWRGGGGGGGESRRQASGTARIERADRRVCGDDRDAAGFMIRVSSRMTFRRMELSQHRKAVEGQVLLRSSCQGAPGLAFDEQPVPFIELAQSFTGGD